CFPTEVSSLGSLVCETRTSLRSAEHGHAERTAPAGISRARARGRAKDAAYASNSRAMQVLFVVSRKILFSARCALAVLRSAWRASGNYRTKLRARETGSCARQASALRVPSFRSLCRRQAGRRSARPGRLAGVTPAGNQAGDKARRSRRGDIPCPRR